MVASAVCGVFLLAASTVSALPACVPNGTWPGVPCEWPSSPPSDCPFTSSDTFSGVSFSGRFGAYLSTSADTWYPFPSKDGSLFSSFADGRVCTTTNQPPPLPPDLLPLLWYWSSQAQDNVLTTAAYPPAPQGYEYIGIFGYGYTLNGSSSDRELKLWHGRDDYFTTSGPADEEEAIAANYTLVAGLGAVLPLTQPPPDPRVLPPTTTVNMPAGETGWSPVTLFYSASRNDHFSSPEPIPPGEGCRVAKSRWTPLFTLLPLR